MEKARSNTSQVSRRLFLAAAVSNLTIRGQDADSGHGWVRPAIALPDLGMIRADGSIISLHALLGDQATAIQLMFTDCRTTCPMEGAIFEKVQALLPDQTQRHLQLLSLSINPAGEQAGSLDTWLRRFHARAGWSAAFPAQQDRPAFVKLFGTGRSTNDPHSTQVQIVDRRHQLIWRTGELPAAEEIANILRPM